MLLTEFINFLIIIFFGSEQPDESNLPKWVKVSKQKFDVIKKKLKMQKLIICRLENILSDINKLVSAQSININQVSVLNILFMLYEIFTGESVSIGVNKKGNFEIFKEKSDKEKQETDEQLDTTGMPELESEESAAERRNQPGKELKILTPDQMLSRLPII